MNHKNFQKPSEFEPSAGFGVGGVIGGLGGGSGGTSQTALPLLPYNHDVDLEDLPEVDETVPSETVVEKCLLEFKNGRCADQDGILTNN